MGCGGAIILCRCNARGLCDAPRDCRFQLLAPPKGGKTNLPINTIIGRSPLSNSSAGRRAAFSVNGEGRPMASEESKRLRATFATSAPTEELSAEAERQSWEDAVEAVNQALDAQVTPAQLDSVPGEWVEHPSASHTGAPATAMASPYSSSLRKSRSRSSRAAALAM
jgi:hypothetical protein